MFYLFGVLYNKWYINYFQITKLKLQTTKNPNHIWLISYCPVWAGTRGGTPYFPRVKKKYGIVLLVCENFLELTKLGDLQLCHPLSFEESKLRQIEAHALIYLRLSILYHINFPISFN